MARGRTRKASDPPCRVIKPGEVPAQKAIEWHPQKAIEWINSNESPKQLSTASQVLREVPLGSASPATRRKKPQTQRISVNRISENMGLMKARIKFEAAEHLFKEAEKYRNLTMANMYRELDQLLGNLSMLNLETGGDMESPVQQPQKRAVSPTGSDEEREKRGRRAERN